jgi:hypothetical protein
MGVTGHCIIQTLHPAYFGEPDCDGWRQGSWAAFTSKFIELLSGCFPTLSSWLFLFTDCGLQIAVYRLPFTFKELI